MASFQFFVLIGLGLAFKGNKLNTSNYSLFKQYQKGDLKALEKLFANNYSYFLHIAVSALNSSFFAKDVIQDVIIELVDKQKKYALQQIEKPEALLTSIIKRRAFDRNKSKAETVRKEKASMEEVDTHKVIQAFIFQDLYDQKMIDEDWFQVKKEQIFKILDLKEKEGKVLDFFISGLKAKEIAEKLNTDPGTISSTIYNVRKKVKRQEALLRNLLSY